MAIGTNDTMTAGTAATNQAEIERQRREREKARQDALARKVKPATTVTPTTRPDVGTQVRERDTFAKTAATNVAAPKRSQYDIARQRASAGAAQEKERRMEALQRRLAAQGMSDSGFAEKQARGVEQDVGREKAYQMGDIEAQEAAATETRQEAERQRAFELQSQREKIFSDENLAYARLGLDEKKFAENQRQFDNDFEFKAAALQAGFDEASADRMWEAVQNEREIAASAEEIGIRGAEERETQAAAGGIDKELAELSSRLRISEALTEEEITKRAETRDSETRAAYNMGFSGEGLTPEEMKAIQRNPALLAAYKAGNSGRSYEEAKKAADRVYGFEDTLLTAAGDPGMLEDLLALGTQLGVKSDAVAGQQAPGVEGDAAAATDTTRAIVESIKGGDSPYLGRIKSREDPVYRALLNDDTVPRDKGKVKISDGSESGLRNSWISENYENSLKNGTPVRLGYDIFVVTSAAGEDKAGLNNTSYTLKNIATGNTITKTISRGTRG